MRPPSISTTPTRTRSNVGPNAPAARVLECLDRYLEQQARLRIQRRRFAWRDPEVPRVEAIDVCEVLYISKAAFMSCLKDNFEVAMLILRAVVGRLREADRKIARLALMDVHGRVARLIIELARELCRTNHVSQQRFDGLRKRYGEQWLVLVVATLVAALPSTKNREGKRDPEMHSSKKGNQWYFGMKAHVGVDAESGLVHTAGVTTGKVHDAKVMANLVREDDTAVYGDKGYASEEKQRAAEDAGVFWAVKEKAKPGQPLTKRQRARNRRFGKVRAKVEHVFRVVKCQFGYRKVRYRGIAKNGAQVFALLALANLYLVRGRLAIA